MNTRRCFSPIQRTRAMKIWKGSYNLQYKLRLLFTDFETFGWPVQATRICLVNCVTSPFSSLSQCRLQSTASVTVNVALRLHSVVGACHCKPTIGKRTISSPLRDIVVTQQDSPSDSPSDKRCETLLRGSRSEVTRVRKPSMRRRLEGPDPNTLHNMLRKLKSQNLERRPTHGRRV